jgi:septal ring factor EnvC (AmiA/AmiB activator)
VKEKVREGKTRLAAQENHIASLHSELEKSQKTKNELDEKMNSQTIEIATLKETLENMAVEKTSLEKEAQKVKAQLDGQFEETRRKKELFSGFMQAYFLSESNLDYSY